MTAQPTEAPDWECCEEEGCFGVRLKDDTRCLAHTTAEHRENTLEGLRDTAHLDVRGVHLSQDLLDEILAASPRPDGRPWLRSARFDRVTFEDGTLFREARFAGASFAEATFGDGAVFAGAGFEHGASLAGANFGDGADFSGATFYDRANFSGATFGHRAAFSKATFGEAVFIGATFGDKAVFYGAKFEAAVFHGATFGHRAAFSKAKFGDGVLFGEAKFGDEAVFAGAQFGDLAFFAGARFGDLAVFAGATFGDEAVFAGATFGDRVSFSGATFGDRTRLGPLVVMGSLSLDGVTFRSTTVDVSAARMVCTDLRFLTGGTIFRVRWAEIDFTGADFREATIVSSRREAISGEDALLDRVDAARRGISGTGPVNASRPRVVSLSRANVASLVLNDTDLAPCRFAGAHNLDKLRLEGGTTFAKPPTWRESGRPWWRWTSRDTLAEEHEWRARKGYGKRAGWYPKKYQCSWLEDPEPIRARGIASLYRSLRKAREDAKNEPGAADFYYGEMEMRRKATSTPSSERWVLNVYWFVSGYALRAGRALLVLFFLLLLSSALIARFGFPSPQPSGAVALTVTTDSSGHLVVSAKAPDPQTRSFKTHFANAWWVALEAAIFRGSQTQLTSTGEHVRTAVRFFGPVMLGLTLLSIRSRVKR